MEGRANLEGVNFLRELSYLGGHGSLNMTAIPTAPASFRITARDFEMILGQTIKTSSFSLLFEAL
jgi:hypothetical protein